MRYLLLTLIACIGKCAFAQDASSMATPATTHPGWYAATDTLKEPRNNTGYYVTVAYFSRYDTIPCTYTVAGSKQHRKGYKYVYVLDGYYTDDASTLQVFYDHRMRRVFNVERFRFK